MAFSARGSLVRGLTFGHFSAQEALGSLRSESMTQPIESKWEKQFVDRLRAYANGVLVDFSDVELDLKGMTSFQQRVLGECREISYGRTLSYGDLARRVGSPRAARAVGSVMAINPVPLVVPCHRVIGGGGNLGGYSASQGIAMKHRLLKLEGVTFVGSELESQS